MNIKKLEPEWFKKLRWRFSDLKEIFSIYNSPFVRPVFKFYFGKIQHGTPYFLPRKWVKMNKQDCIEALERDLARAEKNGWKFSEERTWQFYKNYNYKKPVRIKYFGVNFTSLGWKTKYEDIRFEWTPSLSIVLFGKQLMIWMGPPTSIKDTVDSYWEAYLWYLYKTDKTEAMVSRLITVFDHYCCSWTRHHVSEGVVEKGDDYYSILKPKWIPVYEKWKLFENGK